MLDTIKESLWTQFGASIDMLKNAIAMSPDEHWKSQNKFFYMAYHCLVFLDYYLTPSPKSFSSALSFTLAAKGVVVKDAIDDVIPDRIYSKTELLHYLQSSRERCYKLIMGLTEEKLAERWINEGGHMNYSQLEILLYNMRHVQHHAAQLNMMLRQSIDSAPRWVSRAER